MKTTVQKQVKTAVIIVLLITAIYLIYAFVYAQPSTVIQVKTTQLTTGNISNNVTATGTLEPVDQISVGTQVSGLINKIYVDYNSVVAKGQLLAEIDKTTLTENVSNAKAQYNAALNELNYYKQNYNRQKNMYDAEVISKADLEQADYQLINAKNTVLQRKTTLSQAQTNLGYANIYSPIDGVVISREVDEGQTVAASMSTPELFTIAKDLTKMQVEANVDEADIGNVATNQRVAFTVDAFPGESFSGQVTQIRLNPTVTSNVVTYTVIISANNPELKLKPGLTATVTIFTKELNNIPLLSAAALNFSPDQSVLQSYYDQNDITTPLAQQTTNPGKTYVWVQDASKILQQKEITIGESDGINVQIKSGLNNNDQIVTALKEATIAEADNSGGGSSPFMPTPPKRGSQKSTSSQQAPPPQG
ncbi:MAG: efflux RND transporter periplasmic adaptor subunit [Flavobacteriaceae bacterium]